MVAGICLALGTAALGCSAPLLEETRLTDGRTLGMVPPSTGLAVVLILHPQECLQCLSSLSIWIDARRRTPEVPVRFLLSRPPTERESAQLRLHRITVDGTLADRIPIDGLTGLHALVYQDQVWVASRDMRGQRTSDSLLAALRQAGAHMDH